MTLQELYKAIDGNYSEAKARLMTESLMDRFVIKFLAEPSMDLLTAAVETGDIEASFQAAHTLKGVAANMAFTRLAERVSELTEQLRSRTEPADPRLFRETKAIYVKTITAIQAYQAQKE